MITSEGGLKILDFGLARLIAEPTLGALSGVATLLGTPHYLAPEQIAGAPAATDASDIFSVGLDLYEFLFRIAGVPGDSGPAICSISSSGSRRRSASSCPTSILISRPSSEGRSKRTAPTAISRPRRDGCQLERVQMREAARPPDDSEAPGRHRPELRGVEDASTDAGSITELGDRRLDAIAQRLTAQIAAHLAKAAAHLQSEEHEAAIEHCDTRRCSIRVMRRV